MKSLELPVGYAIIFTFLLAFNVYVSVKKRIQNVLHTTVLKKVLVVGGKLQACLTNLNHVIKFQDKKIEQLMNGVEYGAEDFVAKVEENDDAGLLEKMIFQTSATREKRAPCEDRCQRKKPRGCHLVGVKQPKVNRNKSHFLWADPRSNLHSHCDLTLEYHSDQLVKTIVIKRNGSYLVYAQLTLYSTGITEVGFDTKLLDGFQQNESEREVTLMRTWIRQHHNASIPNVKYLDSGYHSGYFKLFKGQKLQVHQVGLNVHVFLSEPAVAYFGVVFLK